MAQETEFEKSQRENREYQERQEEGARQYTESRQEALKQWEAQQEALKQSGQKLTPEQVQANVESLQSGSQQFQSIAQAHGKFVAMGEQDRQKFLEEGLGRDNRDLAIAAPAAPGNGNDPKGAGNQDQSHASPAAGSGPNGPKGPGDRDPEALLDHYREIGDLSGKETPSRPGGHQRDVEFVQTTNPYSDMAQSAFERDLNYAREDQRLGEQIEAETDPQAKKRLEMVREIETCQHEMVVSNSAANICGLVGNEKDAEKCRGEYERQENRRNELLQALADFDGHDPNGPGQNNDQNRDPNGPDQNPGGPSGGNTPSHDQGQQLSERQQLAEDWIRNHQGRDQPKTSRPEAEVRSEVRDYGRAAQERAQAVNEHTQSRQREHQQEVDR